MHDPTKDAGRSPHRRRRLAAAATAALLLGTATVVLVWGRDGRTRAVRAAKEPTTSAQPGVRRGPRAIVSHDVAGGIPGPASHDGTSSQSNPCASTAPRTVPRHQHAGTTRMLVPGHPIDLFACRYHGFNQPQRIGTFASEARPSASLIAGGLNATRRPPPGIVPICPADFGETYMLWFVYPDGSRLLVRFDNGGCRYVTNGDLNYPFPPMAVTRQLEAALGQDVL